MKGSLYWSIRREIWGNRSIYLAPLAVVAVFLVGFSIGLIGLPGRTRAALALDPVQQREAIQQPYVVAALVLMAVALLVALFYCLDALYGDRRDRSVLFWKSLPVTDVTTVLAKASIPILVLPVVTFALTVATQLVMLLMSSAVLAASGVGVATPWADVQFLEISLLNLVHVVGFHGLWYAPLYGWLLLVSAWAKRAPILWATLPLVAIGAVEKLAFGSSHFVALLRTRVMGSSRSSASGGAMTMDIIRSHPLGGFLMSPGMWIGLAVFAVFLFLAVRLYRSREAI